MYLGDGLLFELQNGKPKLIVLNHGAERNLVKNSPRPRPTYVVNSGQPSNVRRPAAPRGPKTQAAEIGASFGSAGRTRGSQTASETRQRRTAAETASEVKCGKSSCASAEGTSAQAERRAEASDAKSRAKDSLGDEGPTDAVACLSGEQTSGQGVASRQQEVGGGGESEDDTVGGCDETTRREISPAKDNRCGGGLPGWPERRHDDSTAKKAEWRQQLNEQVALKQQQQQITSLRLQAEEGAASVPSGQPAACRREQPAALRSSLRLGAVTPMEEALVWERREEQRKLWLQDLDRQREEICRRRKQEKKLLTQEEDHELWTAHFDSLQRKAPAVTPVAPPVAPPPAAPPADGFVREASSSLSLTWDASSSCGAESAGRASVDTGDPTRSSYLRSMTALLDPAQVDERQRRRRKQLEQQRDIRAQMDERQRRRREQEARRRTQEQEDESRIALERDLLCTRFRQEERKEEQPKKRTDDDDDDAGGAKESVGVCASPRPAASVDDKRDTAVQTDAESPSTASEGKRAAGAENTRVPAGAQDARTETRKQKYNTHRPSRRSVPESERYPAGLQRSRRESRLKRQEDVNAPQHASRLPGNRDASRPPGHKKDWNRASVSAKRGRSPPVTQPALQFIPYVRTDDVVHLDPTDTADAPPPHPHTASNWAPPPEIVRGTPRQQEILRGLAQLRQGLLEKQKELESDLQRHGNERLAPSKR